MPVSISRAAFLKGLAGCAVAAITGKLLWDWKKKAEDIPVRLLGPSRSWGHMLRDGKCQPGSSEAKVADVETVIIGGGIAGLSAAWWLEKNGYSEFVVLELEKSVGGNSQSGKNKISAYPWGAHYIPLANEESTYVRQIFQELGVIEKFDQSGTPVYNELYLCHDPQERLFKDGSFQEGLVPNRGLQSNAREDIRRFFKQMKDYRSAIGTDGKPAFAIPLDLSSQDKQYLDLDNISMAKWLKDNGYSTKQLLWYVNYCCRDDYGATTDNVSAWAAIHYFAGRRGRAAN
ncbi:MAG: FAD-dependent oxidoreductase, partial [Cyanobacteria bacterium]|nr:FAD-dependent oxidoreductase [Cyanobacteriota bacterium]